MFNNKMDVQKELDKLATEEQNLRNKYGRRFSTLYHTTIDAITANKRIIEQATSANVDRDAELRHVINALEVINYEV